MLLTILSLSIKGVFGGHRRSRSANQNIPLAVDQGSRAWVYVWVCRLLFARLHSPCLFWKSESHLHLHPLAGRQFTSRVSLEALVKYWLKKRKKVLFSEGKEGKTFYWPPSVGPLSAQLQPSPHGVPSIQRRNINHMKCISAWTGLLCPIHI